MTKKLRKPNPIQGSMVFRTKNQVRPNLEDFGIIKPYAYGNWYKNLRKLILKCPCSKHVNYWKHYFDSSGTFIGDPKKP